MKLIIIISVVILLAVGGAFYFISNKAVSLPDDLGAATPQQMFTALSEAARSGDIASAERYFSSKNPEGRKIWANILSVNKEGGLLGRLADGFATARFLKSILENHQQFVIHNPPQSQGILADVVFDAELAFWQIQSLALMNVKK